MWFGVLAWVAWSGVVQSTSTAEIEAITTARHDLELGFTIGGKVVDLPVKPGDKVEKGQLLVRLENREGEVLIALYDLRAQSEVAVKSAEAQLQLARVEEEAIRKAFENDAAKPIEVKRAEIQSTLAELELKMAHQRQTETYHQLDQARARDEQYTMLAPTDGVIDMVVVEQGEVVEALKPILRLVVTDPLRVDAAVPTDQTMNLKVGQPAWVKSLLLGYDRPVEGTIIHLAEVADAASDTRLVRVEVPNTHNLPAGVHVEVGFDSAEALGGQAAAEDPAGARAADAQEGR